MPDSIPKRLTPEEIGDLRDEARRHSDWAKDRLKSSSADQPPEGRGRSMPSEERLKELEEEVRALLADLPPVKMSDFETAFGMTAEHMREHYPEAYRHAVTLELSEEVPSDEPCDDD